MKATVVIPTRDRAHLLRNCLEALSAQTLPSDQFEVVVVDNGSRDNTTEVAEAYASKLNVVYTYAERPGLHIGRHIGANLARTNILIFGDDDIVPGSGWVQAVTSAFQSPDVVMVGGNNYPLFQADPPEWLNHLWKRPVYKGRALGTLSLIDFGVGQFEIDPSFIWGCNFSIRRNVLIEAGGFHPDAFPKNQLMYRGDGESAVSKWVRERSLRAVFDSRASVQHFVAQERMTPEYFCSRYFAQGISDSYTDLRKGGGSLSLRNRARNVARRLWHVLKVARVGGSIFRGGPAMHLAEIERLALKEYWCGYRKHQEEAKRDPALFEWIMRDSYFSD